MIVSKSSEVAGMSSRLNEVLLAEEIAKVAMKRSYNHAEMQDTVFDPR